MAKKKEEKRLNSTKKYIDALFEQNSKINIIRIDLSYTKPHSDEITLEEVNKDINRLLNNRRSKPTIFENNIGYVVKKEHTEDKGIHLHCILAFDGNKVLKDAHKAKQIGNYWVNEITQGKGCFHNCNRNHYEENGVGMIDHRDTDKRKILDEVVLPYLCKNDNNQDLPVNENKKDRAFTRGITPKSKGNKGRPRN